MTMHWAKSAAKILCLFLVATHTFSCQEGFKTAESGLSYRFVERTEDGRKPVEGEILVLKMIYRTSSDSVLFDYREDRQLPRRQLGKPSHSGGCFEDAFALMSMGDSMVFQVDAQSFYERTLGMPVPDFIQTGEKIQFEVRLAGIQSFEEVKAERDAARHSNEAEEMDLLAAYLKRTNISIEPSSSGLYYVPIIEGKGKKAQAGKRVVVHYTGKLIDGQVFDTSIERHQPFEFSLGQGDVIQGWEEGIAQMREGGKAMLIIPSHLAYGNQQKGSIAPFSTLIFEVELIKVLN